MQISRKLVVLTKKSSGYFRFLHAVFFNEIRRISGQTFRHKRSSLKSSANEAMIQVNYEKFQTYSYPLLQLDGYCWSDPWLWYEKCRWSTRRGGEREARLLVFRWRPSDCCRSTKWTTGGSIRTTRSDIERFGALSLTCFSFLFPVPDGRTW